MKLNKGVLIFFTLSYKLLLDLFEVLVFTPMKGSKLEPAVNNELDPYEC